MEFPTEFIDKTSVLLGNEWDDFKESLTKETPVTVRINSTKIQELLLPNILWCKEAYQLKNRPLFTLDPLIHAGAYYVQEANSMFLKEALRQTVDFSNELCVLDLCAAPGGKSTLVSSMLNEKSVLVANEVIKSRASVLKENVQKWGKGNVIVTNNDAKDFSKLPSFFDIIVADLPCSGEGMFRKDPKAIEEWSVNHVHLCAERQKRIVSSVWTSLKEGGVLLYSTCTYNEEENEKNVGWIQDTFDAEIISLTLPDTWGIVASKNGCRFYPHRTPGEGFFLAVLRKKGNVTEEKKSKNGKKDFSFLTKKEQEISGKYLLEKLNLLQWRNIVFAFTFSPELFFKISETLYVIHFGVEAGEFIRDKFKPSSTLVYSSFYAKENFDFIELSHENALKFLKKENILLADKTLKEWIVFTFKGVSIGLAKNLGNRINNYFPKEWVIRMDINTKSFFCLLDNAKES